MTLALTIVLAVVVIMLGLFLHTQHWWHDFWFGPVSGARVALWRTAVGAVALGYGVSLAWDLRRWFASDGVMPNPQYRRARTGFFRWFDSDLAMWGLWIALLIGALLLIVGRLVPLAAPVVWYALMSFHLDNFLLLNSADDFIRIMAGFLALYAVVGPRGAASTPLLGVRSVDGTRSWPEVPGWVLRMAQLQLTVIYPATFIAKIPGTTWREGTAVLWSLELVNFARWPIPFRGLLGDSLFLGKLLTWGTLWLEFMLPLFLWYRPTRRLGIVLGLFMHFAFEWTMSLGFFFWAMVLGYLSFLDGELIERVVQRFSSPAKASLRQPVAP